jgi:hypothetical protein
VRINIFFFIGITFLLILTDCQKSGDSDTNSNAVFTGYDARACVCCGGLMINFNNDTIPYSGTFYLVNELPSNPVIDNNTKFPLYARVTWKFSPRNCGGTNFVDIKKLEIK